MNMRNGWMAGVVGMSLLIGGCAWLEERQPGPRVDQGEVYLEQARQFREQGDVELALIQFRLALAENPRLTDAHIGVGDIYHEQGDYATAAERYRVARDLEPRNFDANYKLGLMYHLMDRVREAVREYLAALAIDPQSYDANLNIATAYLQINEPRLGLPYARAAARLRPESQTAAVNLGSIHSAMGQWEEAITAYRSAAELGPLDPRIGLNLARALLRTDRTQQAINVLRTSVQVEPTPAGFERLGYAYFRLGDLERSLEAYERALELSPDDPASMNGVGVILMTQYLQGGRSEFELRDRAIEMWRRSLRVQPDQQRIVDLIARYRSA